METHLEAGGGEGGVVEEPRKVLRLFRIRVLLNLKPTHRWVRGKSSGITYERRAGCERWGTTPCQSSETCSVRVSGAHQAENTCHRGNNVVEPSG